MDEIRVITQNGVTSLYNGDVAGGNVVVSLWYKVQNRFKNLS